MKLLVGLGNPGEQYVHTRHNFGFQVVEKLLKDFESAANAVWTSNAKLKSEIALIHWQPKVGKAEQVILAKPQTHMNNSGMAVSLLSSFYKVAPEDIWIINDELDLPLGAMKIRFGGAAAGHHGVESIMEALGTDQFWRFRMGIGSHRSGMESNGKTKYDSSGMKDYVLDTFTASEHGKARELLKHGSDALQMALEKGMEAAMNRYNTK